jgi:glycosyltransferase involved in cell wall biosynthesis
MPGCLIEAGMTGMPAAAYAVGGVADVLLHQVTGLLVPAGDVSGLENSAFELIRDPEMRRTMSLAAIEHCRSRFDISSIAPRYLRLYDDVIGDQ